MPHLLPTEDPKIIKVEFKSQAGSLCHAARFSIGLWKRWSRRCSSSVLRVQSEPRELDSTESTQGRGTQ